MQKRRSVAMQLSEIIKKSSFVIHPGIFWYAKSKQMPKSQNFFMVSKDEDEVTIVGKQEKIRKLEILEKNKDDYSLIELKVSIPFYSVGFLAAVSSEIAKENMNVLIVSTYSKDYILVKYDSKEKARKILVKMGFKQETSKCT